MVNKIKLEGNKDFKDFMKDNEETFWELVIESAIKLYESDLEECVSFILYGGAINGEKKYVVNKNNLEEVVEKAIPKMEEYEKYELCSKLLEIKNNII